MDIDIIKLWNEKPVDYLLDFPLLTLMGRMAGMKDEDIREMNKKVSKDPELMAKIYFDENAI